MKQDDVKVGETYLTKIGEAWARVIVVRKRQAIPAFVSGLGVKHRAEKASFDVRREKEEKVLPKPRSAAALQPLPHGTKPARVDEVSS